MHVELEQRALLAAAATADTLARDISGGAARTAAASPVSLPSLSPMAAKARWLSEQVPMLEQLAALALMLDTDADGQVAIDLPGATWDPAVLLQQSADQRFGPGFVDATGLEGEELTTLLLTLGSVGQDLPDSPAVMTPDQLRTFVIDHPQVARALQQTHPAGSGPGAVLYGLTLPFMTAPGGGAEVWEQRRLEARELFEGLSPDDAAILAMTYPSIVGNLPGVPFANRADANTVNVVVALDDEQAELADLRERHEHNQHDWDFLGLNNDDLEGPIEDAEDRVALYRSILADDRQIVYFDPSGDGSIAELHAPIDPRTQNVGVLVPGTGSDLSNFQGTADRSLTFQDNAPPGSLAMISWMGGDLPDDIVQDAPFANYSVDLGPRLADFSRDLALEIDHSAAPDAQVTVAGHSYGGAVVGRSELSGLVADRVLHIESAGMGHDIEGPGDLPDSQGDVDRYSMTAPGDVIGLIQGTQAGDNIGHGADPDSFDGTVRLHTGNKVDGSLNTGVGSHTSVFQEHSDAWQNMFEVFTGGTVETYRSPDYYYPPPGPYGSPSMPVQVGWEDDGERIDIE